MKLLQKFVLNAKMQMSAKKGADHSAAPLENVKYAKPTIVQIVFATNISNNSTKFTLMLIVVYDIILSYYK